MNQDPNARRMEAGHRAGEQYSHRSNARSLGYFYLRLWLEWGEHQASAKDGRSSWEGGNQKSRRNTRTIDQQCGNGAHQGNQTMRIPLERVALILTYIKKKNIQDWRMRMVNEIEWLTRGAPNCPAIPPEDKVLWNLFERDFRNAFTDSQKQLTAHQKFLKVKMQGNALDEFIAEFEHLRSKAGWSSNDIGTITQFRHSLNTGLLKAIVQHV